MTLKGANMPHADLFYTSDQPVKAAPLLAEIEALLLGYDSGAGQCKGRGHRVEEFHHSHMHLRLSMLPKAHRNADWARELGERLAQTLRPHARAETTVTVNITFDLLHYTALKV